tara:strand:- start:720 stop:1001 length:282 start_codon:yes stop_codon:yes gene_type:complete
MRVEHGTYTECKNIISSAGAQTFSYYPAGSKILPAIVEDGRKCTFQLIDDTEVELALFSGTVIPVVTKGCKFEDSVTSGEIVTILDSAVIPID